MRRVVDDIPPRLWAVAVIGFWERFTFWGLTAPWRTSMSLLPVTQTRTDVKVLENFMENSRYSDSGAPGALGLGQAMATRIYCAFYILYYVTPLLFAIISDVRLGRFKTLCLSVVLYVLGCGVLVASSSEGLLNAGFGLAGFLIAMTLVALGGGGFKMLMVPFIADQYTAPLQRIKTLRTGERVLTDRSLTVQYIYNLYYWVGNVGSLSWFATTTLEKYYSFTVAYSVTFGSMVIAMVMLFMGSKWYAQAPHEGNVLPSAVRILVCASRNGFKMSRAYPEYQLEERGKSVTWDNQLVDELCRGLRACRVLIAFVVFYVCFDQMQNNLISQANQMKTNGIPNDMMPAMNQVACIILGPIIQYGLYPYLNRRKIPFRPIARITVGFLFIALSMLYSMTVQHLVYSAPPCYTHPGKCDLPPPEKGPALGNNVNVWIQAPVYFLMAIGEIFAYVTGLEYAYDHSPTAMKAIVQAISLLVAGVGSAVAMALTPVARDPNLTILYGSLFGAMTVTAATFWWRFRKYDSPSLCETSGGELAAETEGTPNEGTSSVTLGGIKRHHRAPV
ncbi:PTR2-domain-containing protein [Westerdykella ornata]|uniref:PTR2-domain-containing protein n=1 Tax=Westerdykella ornata TaxID=318751 RepID=A0A6A6JN45_WESOR|nr:PTR2-domain-containing protein [Westerdykella ornata]KAF2278031.1 PTR2-domain-containing protein [Westerdykella ornata]